MAATAKAISKGGKKNKRLMPTFTSAGTCQGSQQCGRSQDEAEGLDWQATRAHILEDTTATETNSPKEPLDNPVVGPRLRSKSVAASWIPRVLVELFQPPLGELWTTLESTQA